MSHDRARLHMDEIVEVVNDPRNTGIQRNLAKYEDVRESRSSFDDTFKDLYAAALTQVPKSVEDLEDPKKYAAACLACMKFEMKTRAKRDMLIHIGKIFGHDKRTIDIQDKRTYQDVLKTLRDELGPGPVVEGQAVVKALPDARS